MALTSLFKWYLDSSLTPYGCLHLLGLFANTFFHYPATLCESSHKESEFERQNICFFPTGEIKHSLDKRSWQSAFVLLVDI